MHLTTIHKVMFLAAALLLAGGCKKKEIIPPPGSTSPVFKADGTFNGEVISLHAGDDDVMMYTESQSVDGIPYYMGILGNNQVKIEMGLFGGDVDMVNPEIPDYANVNELSFAYLPTIPLFKVSKNDFPNRELIHHIDWEANGTMVSQDELVIYRPGRYQVCAHVTFSDYSQQTLCNEIIVGFKSNADFELNSFLGQDLSFKSWIKPFGSTVQSVKWFMDENPIEGTDELQMAVSGEVHVIRAEVTFANGARRTKSVLVDGTLGGNNIHDFTKAGTIPPPLFWDYSAKLKVTKNGTEYFSQNTLNNDNKIQVDNISYYGLNTEGDPVYILTGTVDANLKSVTGAPLPVHMNVSFGFAAH